jgi:signal transduction histidine kinase
MSERMVPGPRRPSRAVSLAVSAALVLLWGYIRLVFFADSHVPIAYVLPMLVCLWTRDRQILWGMAATFAVFHTLKVFWILPEGAISNSWAIYLSTLVNIGVVAVVLHLVIGLRARLEASLARVQAQADELQAQADELQVQGEELAQQNEELSQQGEELAQQNEELQSQAEEIGGLNDVLERREQLLQALLETARVSGSESAALDQIAHAARDLFPGHCAAIALFEAGPGGLRLAASAGGTNDTIEPPGRLVADGFVDLVLRERRTASLSDAALRPDLRLAAFPSIPPLRAALCAPVPIGPDIAGALAVYSPAPHQWTEEEFQLADWLAEQYARVLQTLRVQSDLRELDQRKSEFLATLSHELRNPLAAIGFALRLLESGAPDPRAVDVTRRQLQQLVRLVDDLLDATRLSSNKVKLRKEVVDLRQIVREAVDASTETFHKAQHQLAVTVPEAPVWTDGDRDRLAQIVTNLLSNAARYTPASGRVRVTLAAGDGESTLSVSDTGVGMKPEDLDRVFDMFTQAEGADSGGLGIGLALVKGIAELHGGRVQAQSAGPGLGSTFIVTLPLHAGVREAPDHAPAAPVVPSCRVLVVDDNVDAAEMMAALLEAHGHSVRIAHDAQAAIEAARQFEPDAAVLDIGLPGTDGYELARWLRRDARTAGTRLVALTGWGQEGDRSRARAAGFDAHLTKPADPEAILAAIASTEPA